MTTYTHKHHIIPKHMGGTDDPDNLVELTVEDHAIAHYVRYRMFGRWQDRLAWNGLANRITHEEAVRQAVSDSHKGKTYEEIHGAKKGQEMRKARAKQMTRLRRGKTWEEIFGPEKARQRKERRARKCTCTICKKEMSSYQFNNHLRRTHHLLRANVNT